MMDTTNVYLLKQIMRDAKEVRVSARKSSIISISSGIRSWWPKCHRFDGVNIEEMLELVKTSTNAPKHLHEKREG